MAFLSAPVFQTSFKPSSRNFLSPRQSSLRVSIPRPPATRVAIRNNPVRTPIAAYEAKQVTADELEKILLANERPILVDAFAPWCGPCQFLLPQLDIVAERFQDKLDILKLDTEEFPDLASVLRVRGLPTLFFIKDGKLRYRMEGAIPADELEKLINFVLFDGPPPAGVEIAKQPVSEV